MGVGAKAGMRVNTYAHFSVEIATVNHGENILTVVFGNHSKGLTAEWDHHTTHLTMMIVLVVIGWAP